MNNGENMYFRMSIYKKSISTILIITLLTIFSGCNYNPRTEGAIVLQKIVKDEIKYDSNVVPIDWDKFNTRRLTGDLANEIVYSINNSNKYALNSWWKAKKHFDNQKDKEYLTLSGINEVDIRSVSQMARLVAVSLKLNIYDEKHTGVPEKEAEEMTLKLVKSLAKAHVANKTGGWGNQWQSAHWAADVGFAGWLLWEKFSPADQELIQKVIVHEADRFLNYKVPYYMDSDGKIVYKGDTKAEENAWNANLLTIACSMMPNHEHYNLWMYKNIELIISSYAFPSDVESEDIVNAFVLKDILKGSNINEDGTVVNHNIIHPDYQEAVLTLNLSKTPYFVLGGLDIPQALLLNTNKIYEGFTLLDIGKYNQNMKGKRIYECDESGAASAKINYPNGSDWGVDRQHNYFNADIFAFIYGLDMNCTPKAIDFAYARMDLIKSMQDRSGTGQFYMPGDSNSSQVREEWVAFHLVNSYLALWAYENDLLTITHETMLKPACLSEVKLTIPKTMLTSQTYKFTYKLNAGIIVLPNNTVYTYTSSNESVIKISDTNIIEPIAAGTCDITIMIEYGGIKVSDTITVIVESD